MIRLVRAGGLATLVAVVATGLVAVAARAAGVELVVDGGELPVSGIVFVTGVFSLVGVMLAAALLRWSGRPAELFVRISVGLTVLSLVPPLLWSQDVPTTVTLVVLHLVAAAVMIPALASALDRPISVGSGRRTPPARSGAAQRRRRAG